MKSAAEHDGERRAQRRNYFEPRGGDLRSAHLGCLVLTAATRDCFGSLFSNS
jgi:hypothetical protein